jgi:hypothetical protein
MLARVGWATVRAGSSRRPVSVRLFSTGHTASAAATAAAVMPTPSSSSVLSRVRPCQTAWDRERVRDGGAHEVDGVQGR